MRSPMLPSVTTTEGSAMSGWTVRAQANRVKKYNLDMVLFGVMAIPNMGNRHGINELR